MSAPQKTSAREIRSAARQILEESGLDNVSMQAVADAVGVRAPSLYKHFANRGDLLTAVTEDALGELQRTIDKVVQPGDSALDNLLRMANAYRTFAKRNPESYKLIFSPAADAADLEARQASAATLLKMLTDSIGPERALPGARTLVAYLHGFVVMETGDMFRFGGSINQAFEFGLRTILNSLLVQSHSTAVLHSSGST